MSALDIYSRRFLLKKLHDEKYFKHVIYNGNNE